MMTVARYQVATLIMWRKERYTIFGQKGKIHRLETDMAENHVRIPVAPKWYHRLILKRFFGYEYASKEPYESRWED